MAGNTNPVPSLNKDSCSSGFDRRGPSPTALHSPQAHAVRDGQTPNQPVRAGGVHPLQRIPNPGRSPGTNPHKAHPHTRATATTRVLYAISAVVFTPSTWNAAATSRASSSTTKHHRDTILPTHSPNRARRDMGVMTGDGGAVRIAQRILSPQKKGPSNGAGAAAANKDALHIGRLHVPVQIAYDHSGEAAIFSIGARSTVYAKAPCPMRTTSDARARATSGASRTSRSNARSARRHARPGCIPSGACPAPARAGRGSGCR